MTPFFVIARRVAWLLLLAMVGGAVVAWVRDRNAAKVAPVPEWPPLPAAPPGTEAVADEPATAEEPADAASSEATADTAATPDADLAEDTADTADTAEAGATADTADTADADEAGDTADGAPAWVEAPAEGRVPEGYPVKVNTKSGVFHVPGGRFYERTNAQRYYATPDAALADGYRQSKS